MTDAQRSLYCFGLGYTARTLAVRLHAERWHVGGTVRSAEKAEKLRGEGLAADVFDGTGTLHPPAGAHWLVSIPPGETGCPAFAAASAHASEAASVTYLSTIGVYGDLGGGWAFEWSEIHPQSARSQARALAEQQWQASGAPAVSLVRLPGIYGPDRSALDRVNEGKARRIKKPGQVFSRIHVEDIAGGLERLLTGPERGGVFHLCDDEPSPPQDVIAFAAELLDRTPPPEVDFDSADLSDMARSFYSECKRVSNARTKARLGWCPLYPSYREGLRAIARSPASAPARTATSNPT